MTASQGLMLESEPGPRRPPGIAVQASGVAARDDRRSRGLRIPFTSGILVGIGESEGERMDALAALAEVHERCGHLQEVILQNFVPHQSYYGREPADIAAAAASDYWRTGVWDGPQHEAPQWASPVTVEDMKRLIEEARRLMPGVGIQVPPESLGLVGRAGTGGRDRPRRPVRQRRPHLPGAPVPVPRARCVSGCRRRGRSDRTVVRLPRVHRRGLGLAERA